MRVCLSIQNCKVSLNVLFLFLFSFFLVNVQGIVQGDSDIFNLTNVIDTKIQLTKSLAVSHQNSYVIVGGKKGELKVFDYESGNLLKQIDQNQSQIMTILWQNSDEGLVTVSFDYQTNKSTAIQRHHQTFQQKYKWQFPTFVYNVDTISNRFDSYIAFNFMTHVEEYNLNTKRKSATYHSPYAGLFVEMSYSSQYSYLFLSVNESFVIGYKCGSVLKFGYNTKQTITRFEADKNNFQNTPVIYKKQHSGFELLDPTYQFDVTFPKEGIDYFKYCPRDYILGIGLDQTIRIFSRDYKFTELGRINTFSQNGLFIISVICQNGHIFVSASNNRIYVFEIPHNQVKRSEAWIKVVLITGAIFVLVFVIMMVIFIRYRKNKQKSENNTLLSSVHKSSTYSEYLT